jgi:hypothetical protein
MGEFVGLMYRSALRVVDWRAPAHVRDHDERSNPEVHSGRAYILD